MYGDGGKLRLSPRTKEQYCVRPDGKRERYKDISEPDCLNIVELYSPKSAQNLYDTHYMLHFSCVDTDA